MANENTGVTFTVGVTGVPFERIKVPIGVAWMAVGDGSTGVLVAVGMTVFVRVGTGMVLVRVGRGVILGMNRVGTMVGGGNGL